MQRKNGDELFTNQGMYLDFSLSDFWSWYASNLLHGPLRGAVAEYIVCKALEVQTEDGREDWEAFDVLFRGKRIEVKSSAYFQSSEQEKASRIAFSISKRARWDVETKWSELKRNSDLYVFCLLGSSCSGAADPMNVGLWNFYVVKTEVLDTICGDQQTLSLSSLLSMNPLRSSYDDLKQTVETLL